MSYIPPGGFSPSNPPPPGYQPPPAGWQQAHYRPPGSIKVLGIMNIVFASLGALGLLFTYWMYYGKDGGSFLGQRNPVIELAHESPGFMSYMSYSLLIHVVMVIAFFASGIGLIKIKAWGRKLAAIYAVYGIVSTIVSIAVTQHYILGPLSQQHSAAASGGMMGGYMSIIGVVYPLILLIFMFKRNVREHFARAAEPVPTARVV